MRYLLLLVLFLFGCESNLVIVHVHEDFEGAEKIALFVNEQIELYDNVYVLTHKDLGKLIKPNNKIKIIHSDSGEHSLKLNYATVVGGYCKACYANALTCLLIMNEDITVICPKDGVMYGTNRTLREQIDENKDEKNIKKSLNSILGKVDIDSDCDRIIIRGKGNL